MDLRYFYIRTARAARLIISDARAREVTSSVHGELAFGAYDEAMTIVVREIQEILSGAGTAHHEQSSMSLGDIVHMASVGLSLLSICCVMCRRGFVGGGFDDVG